MVLGSRARLAGVGSQSGRSWPPRGLLEFGSVGFFGGDPWKTGVQATAAIERVCVTRWDHDSHHNDRSSQEVFLAFAFVDQDGQTVLQERKWFMVDIPPPGTLVDIAYFAGKVDKVDYDQRSFRPPDPSVPRGWGAGVYEVPDVGTRRPETHDSSLATDRELFRSGRPVEAQVIGVEHDEMDRHGAYGHVLTLEAEGRQFITTVRMPLACAPPEGAGIKMVVGAVGAVALDTDERFYGPPGRALVFSQPPDGYQPRARDPKQPQADMAVRTSNNLQGAAAQQQEMILTQIQQLEAMREAGQMTDAAFESTRAALLSQIRGPDAASAPNSDRLARLEAARAAGRITDHQFEQMKAALDHHA